MLRDSLDACQFMGRKPQDPFGGSKGFHKGVEDSTIPFRGGIEENPGIEGHRRISGVLCTHRLFFTDAEFNFLDGFAFRLSQGIDRNEHIIFPEHKESLFDLGSTIRRECIEPGLEFLHASIRRIIPLFPPEKKHQDEECVLAAFNLVWFLFKHDIIGVEFIGKAGVGKKRGSPIFRGVNGSAWL